MLGAFIQTEVLCISVLRVASGPRVKFAGPKNALTPRCFILLTVLRCYFRCQSALWFILRSVLPCVCSCIVLLALHLPRLGTKELLLVLFVHLFD